MPSQNPRITRRTLIAGTGAAAAGLVATRANAAPPPGGAIDVHVVVVDGLRVDEVNGALMPVLSALAREGSRYVTANAIQVAETLPNHAAMMTGVLPHRNGVPANKIFDRTEGQFRYLERPDDLTVPTMLDLARTQRGLTTASVLSKEYLHGLFQGRASVHWNPSPLIPLTDHAPDQSTMDALLRTLAEHHPRLTFSNLGDVDRVGHIDVTGTGFRYARTAAVRNTDEQLGRFVSYMRDSGSWNRSVIIVVADHSMDWSAPLSLISLQIPFALDPLLRDNVMIADNGGASLWYWTGAAQSRDEAVQRMRRIAEGHAGVASTHETAQFGLGERAGDLVAFCHPGWRFTDPTVLSNPIPGNHGHDVTLPIPLIVSGGHPSVPRGQTFTSAVTTMDVAPTVASLLSISAPPGGFDGAVLPGFSG
ncbi:alkaline phosphatase family protein [Hoyosella subflava]|uniref:Type I phosphodiesterase/nucleotide pyrophosphatase n=1 Tax=Hoyosella subflava (strain DSM 45089 / JCM 17490 / NBRC 109087 / DQS3-9A1) TaxID=443218 RepID=F6EMC7_HOYSD|nr:alkaline phosphatase family protein [Hoyosella subflava]AEF40287.1 Type I phosphodiesterase/nucleotide pyrophosphatase [Hoyosella subflava DQS3-9A1]